MGLFDFVSDWRRKLIDEPLDRKMRQTADIGNAILQERVHVISGYLKSTSKTEYLQSDKTILVHFDAPYAIYEFGRGGAHDAVNPALRAMAHVWGGNFEVHFPNTSVSGREGSLGRMRQAEVRVHSALGGGRGGLAGRTRIISRRWHRWATEAPADPTTPTI